MKHPIGMGIACGVTVLAVAFFAFTLARATIFAPESEIEVPAEMLNTTETVAKDELPVRIRIPSLGIDTDVQHVGLNPKGNMGVPSNFSDVGWYKYGTVPGYRGSAVIDGHVNNGLGLRGVFAELGKIKKGSDIFIETKGGEELRFRVIDIKSYDYKSVPADTLFKRADGVYLNLITCGGSWVKDEKTYDERVVVYTRLLE